MPKLFVRRVHKALDPNVHPVYSYGYSLQTSSERKTEGGKIMAKTAFTEHPQFMNAGQAANSGLHQTLLEMGLEDKDLFDAAREITASRIVDDLTRLLLRAFDAKQAKRAA